MLPTVSWRDETLDDDIAELGDEVRTNRSGLIEQEREIRRLREKWLAEDRPAAARNLDEIAALTAELDQDWADWRDLADRHEALKRRREQRRTPSSSAATARQAPGCGAPRTAPRPRAARPRTISRASSRGGDSGDESSAESDLPPLARLGRALWRALITRWPARVKDPGGD